MIYNKLYETIKVLSSLAKMTQLTAAKVAFVELNIRASILFYK